VFFYAPDVISIHESGDAPNGVRIYIGDGASFLRPLLRKRGRHVIGHTSMRQQLRWCARHKIRRAIFYSCGSQIVAGEEKKLVTKLRRLADELGVKAQVAYDGMTVILR
jgi:hypothetical protein